jgi:hypothetical protein
MGVDSIAEQVRQEIAKLQQVLSLLEGSGPEPKPKQTLVVNEPKTRRTMSAGARKKIAAAQKARWAKFRAAKK